MKMEVAIAADLCYLIKIKEQQQEKIFYLAYLSKHWMFCELTPLGEYEYYPIGVLLTMLNEDARGRELVLVELIEALQPEGLL